MSSKRKGLRYNQKHLDYKREDSAVLRMKVLRSVLAVGVTFALTPWLSRAALAEAPAGNIVRTGSSTNLIVNGKAEIYADQAANGVGINAFKYFTLGNNQIANMYFRTQNNATALHTLVNTVENQISISGTVNALRNNKIGGNLYFLSPKGMVVGASGTINAGSLTMLTSDKTFFDIYNKPDPKAAAAAIAANKWDLDSNASIDIHGKINTISGIDLRAAYINVTKSADATAAPSLKTGVVFAQTVNTSDPALQAANVTDSRLTASVDGKGNVVIADPNEPSNTALQGDGSIKLAAKTTSRNTDTEFLGVTGFRNTAEAKVEVGQGASIDALGNVDISADASIGDLPEIVHFIDMSGFAKSEVNINGSVKGNNVNVSANAQAQYSGNNHANLIDLINDVSGLVGVNIKANMTGMIWNALDKAGKINGKVDILNKIVNQVYMPFNLCEADATINIGSNAELQAEKIVSSGASYGGDVNIGATSVSKNVMTVGLQPKIANADKDLTKYFVGGFIYEDSTSKAIVNVDGIVEADKNVTVKAVAQNVNSSSISVKAPQVYKVPNPRPEDPYESTMVAVGVGVVNQNTQAEINIGSKNKDASLTSANKLALNAASVNSLTSAVAMQNFKDTAVNVAINVVDSEGSATVNNYAQLHGGAVDIAAAHTLNKYTVTNTNNLNVNYTGLDWLLNTEQVREGADSLRDFVRAFNEVAQDAAGDNIQAEEGGEENIGQGPAWNDYFDLGATVTVAKAQNSAKVNLKPTSVIMAVGDVGIKANVNIVDSKIVTDNNFLNSSSDAVAGVSAAVAVESMDNTAEINMDSSSENSITAGGSVALQATTEQRYNRPQQLVQDLLTAFAGTKQYWTTWQSQAALNKKFQNLQNIIVDIVSMLAEDPAQTFIESPRFVAKAKAGIDAVTSLTGTEGIKKALEAFLDVSNYVNMHVSASTDAKENKDTTAMVSGAVGVQKLSNTANVNLGANTKIVAGNAADVNINADAVESNVLLAGKMAFAPDFTSVSGGQYGLGGTVGVQNAYTNSKVQVMNGVKIDAGSINISSINDVLNLGIVFGGSETSKLGITGMVSYMGGASSSETLIDDDIDFTARKKVEHAPTEEDPIVAEDRVTSSGAVQISSQNKTNVINLVGDWNAAEASSVGASVGVISYDVRSLAEITNQELNADGSSAETSGASGTAEQKGSISANGIAVNALTDGIINNFTVAGVNSSKSQNANAAAGGVNVAAAGGQAADGVQNAQINGGAAGGQDAIVKINAVGSTSWNYVVDETKATLDNVNITLTPAEIGAGVTSAELINDKSGFVKVEAEDAPYIGAYSGAMALTKLGNNNHTAFQSALAGAVAVNDLQKNTTATLENSSIERESTAAVAVDVLNYAHNSGAQVAAGLSLGLDVGTRRGGVAINVAGSGSANYVDSTVLANVQDNIVAGGSTTVNNAAYDKDVQVAGGVTVETTTATASAGAAVALNAVTNKIQAAMQNNTVGTAAQKATAVHNLAAANLTQVGTAVSVGMATGDKSYATLNAAVATNTVNNSVEAVIDGGSIYADKLSDEATDGVLSLDRAANKYVQELNQAHENAVVVDAAGNFVQEGVILERAYAVHANGQKVYKVYTLDEAGDYVDEAGHKLACSLLTDSEGNTTGLEYRDEQNNLVDINDVQYFAPSSAGGAGTPVDINALKIENKHYFDLDGSGALTEANGAYGSDFTAAIVENEEQASYTSSALTLTNQGSTIVGVALGLGVKAGNNGLAQGAGAAAVNTNNIKNDFQASIRNAIIETGASSYDSNGSLQEAALKVEAASATSMVSVAAGVSVTAGGQDKVSLALAGSGAVQKIENTTLAAVENTQVTTDYLDIKSSSSSELVTVAGQVGVETSKRGIAAGFSWAENELDNTIGAYAKGITLNGIGTTPAPNLALLSQNNSKAWAVSVGTGVALGYASAEGAYAENHGINNTEAVVEKYKKQDNSYVENTLTNAKKIDIKAEDNTVEKATAGTASVSLGYATLGGAAAYNNIGNGADAKQKVRAILSDAKITTVDNANINVAAINNADFLTLALGAAVRASGSGYIGVGAEGDAAITKLYTNTEAGLDNVNITTTATNKALVEVEANNNTEITSSADALSVTAGGKGGQIGFSAAVSKVHSDADTITSIANSSITAKDIVAKANSNNEILDMAIGLSVGVGQYAGVALAGNVASNVIDNDTTVSLAFSTIKADGTVAALAASKEQLENYGGGLSVGVGTSAAGVAVGATVVTNTITSDTDVIIDASDITALGAGDGVKVAEHKSVEKNSSATNPDPVDDYQKFELQETSAANAAAKKGLVVNAEAEHVLRDISITGGVAVGSAAGVAVDATVVINSITGRTSAQVNSTDINKDKTVSELSNADVYVNAFDKADISSHLDTLSVGAAGEGAGVGAAGAGDRNTIQRNTIAQILGTAGSSNVLNGHNINVDALGYTKLHISETGLAAGASAVAGAAATGSVSVNRFAGNTTAVVSNVQGTAHELLVHADRLTDMRMYNNAISLSGGIVGASVSVGVTDVEDTSHTDAELSNAVLSTDGAAGSKVEVKAQNNTQLSTELSADSLEVSLGESWGIAVSNVNMEAQVSAKLNKATLGSDQQEFGSLTVEADNNTYNKFQNVAVALGSVAGVGVGRGVLNINTGTTAEVLDSSAFANNIDVNAYEKRTVATEMVGVGASALYIGVNTMHTNIGTNLQDEYFYYDSLNSYKTEDFQTMVNGALERMNSQADAARAKTGDSSIQQGNTSINTGHAEDGGVKNTIHNSKLQASNALQANAKATTNTDISIYQASVAIANVDVPVNRTTVEDKLQVDIENATLQGKTIAVTSTTDGEIKSFAGQGGISAAEYVDTTAYVKNQGTNQISIDGSTFETMHGDSNVENTLLIHALNQTHISNSAYGMNVSGIVAGRMVLEGEDSTEVSIDLGMDKTIGKENSFTASKDVDGKAVAAELQILAENAAVIKDEIIAREGIGVAAAGGSIVSSKAKGKASLNVSDKNAFAAQNVALQALTGGTKDEYTTEAINRAVGVSALSVNVDKARTYNEMQASTTVGAIKISDGSADVKIGATNAATSNAYIYSVNVGLGAASGSNLAQSYANGQALTTVNAGTSGISGKNIAIFANNSDDIVARADGSNAGIMDISPYAARIENKVNSTTTVNLSGNFTAAEAFEARALRKDTANFKADALSVTYAGGGDARVDSTIDATTNLDMANAKIVSGNDTILEAANTVEMNRQDGYTKMVLGQGYGALSINTSGIKNTINSLADITLSDSILQSAGKLQAMAHTEEDLQVNGYIYAVGAYEGAEGKVINNITNSEAIKLQNSSLKTTKAYQDITLATADDLKLFTYSYAEAPAGALGGANAILENKILRSNEVAIEGGSNLYSSQDINLYAGKHADGSLATLDLDAEATDFIGAVIPVAIKPTLANVLEQNNQISVDKTSSSTSVRHSNLYAAQGRELASLYANRYVGIYGSSQKGSFVTTDQGKTIDGKEANNSVTIDGKLVAGVANKIDITIGEEGDIVILDKDMRATVAGAKDASGIKLTVDADASTGLSGSSLIFGSEDYANTLYKRYEEVLDVMNEYAKDGNASAAYVGYQDEANRIKQEMLDMGLATLDQDNKLVVKDTLLVDFVEIPELTASGGNLTIDTDDLKGATTGTIKAQGTPEITITNNTNLLTKVNAITVDDAGGKLIYNNSIVTGTSVADFNKNINAINKSADASFGAVDAAAGDSGRVKIQGLYNGKSINYQGSFVDEQGVTQTVAGSIRPMANIQVQGNIYANDGAVEISSAHDNIVIQGKSVQDAVAISGATVVLNADNGSITQGYTNGIVNIGTDVRSQYNEKYLEAIELGNGKHYIDEFYTSIPDDTKGTGSYIAGGNIYINATDINVNGIIQSGFGDYYANISDATTTSRITEINNAYNGGPISDNVVTTGEQYKIIDGGAYWSAQDSCYKYKLNVYYNPSTQKIIVQDVDASGGKVYLTGRISSTDTGKIICLDGVSDININNGTNYTLQLGNLVTHDTEGLISITDKVKNTLTTITSQKVTEQTINNKVQVVGDVSEQEYTPEYFYQPKKSLRYTWTTGKSTTTYKRYKEDFGEGGWGLWSNGVSDEELAQWTVENNPTPIETGTDKNLDRLAGQTIREDGTDETSYVIVTSKTNGAPVTTKESERKYSTGLWGYHKHYEVIWTESSGTLYTYEASIKAGRPLDISFVGSAAGEVNVDSLNNIELTGNIGDSKLYETTVDNVTKREEKGTISIKSQNGCLIQSGGALYGANINLSAAKDIHNINIIAGDVVNVSALNNTLNQNENSQNSIDITVKSAYLAKGNVVLGNMGSVVVDDSGSSVPVNTSGAKTTGVTGRVEVNVIGSEGNISQADDSLLVSDRIYLNTNNGSIYGQKQSDGSLTTMQLYAGQQPLGNDTMSASVNANAQGDIALEQLDGNMRVGRIYSAAGDVTLTAAKGSIEDALPYVANSHGDADEMLARWQRLGIIAGNGSDAENAAMLAAKNNQNQSAELSNYEVWDANALLYAIQDSIVNPEGSSLPKTSDKDPNVIGHNITINVADSVGMNGDVENRIDASTLLDKDASGNYINLDNLKTLSKLDASTKVKWETGADGHTYAVYKETLPIGVQQTTQLDANGNAVSGKLTIESLATSNQNGDIYIQGRNQSVTGEGGAVLTNNLDLHINKLYTQLGDITLTSLGGIYNAASASAPVITGKSLTLTAAGGSIGTSAANGAITTNIFGAEETKDGLTAIATGGIYVDQKGDEALLVRNVSSGGDIYLGSDTDILMGIVSGSEAVNYIRVENNGDMVLEARDGSIGDAIYENGVPKRDENKGVRILNAAKASTGADDKDVSNVTLRASENVYVTGVASLDGKTAAVEGPAGTLNLSVEAVQGTTTLQNVGICVDGALHLDNDVVATDVISVYTTDSMVLSGNVGIDAHTLYLQSAKNVTVADGNIHAAEKVSFEAGQDFIHDGGSISAKEAVFVAQNFIQNDGDVTAQKAVVVAQNNILLNSGSMVATESVDLTATNGAITEKVGYVVDTPGLIVSAGKSIDLDSKVNKLINVDILNAGSNVTIGSGNSNSNDALSVVTTNIVQGDLAISNYANEADAEKNAIVVADKLQANGTITITNQESDVNVDANAAVSAANIKLNADTNAVNINGGNVNGSSNVDASAKNINVAGGKLQAATATLYATNKVTISGGEIAATTANLNSDQDITQTGGSITANNANLTAGKNVAQTGGTLAATNTVVKASTNLSLASELNKLQNVTVDVQNGNATIVNGNEAADDLNVHTVGMVGKDLTITNIASGVDNLIKVDKELKAGGNIVINNQEVGIDVAEDASMSAQNITLTATSDKVTINNGTITTQKIDVIASQLVVNDGTINATDVVANKDLTLAGGIVNATNMVAGTSLHMLGGTVNAANLNASTTLDVLGGSVNVENITAGTTMTMAGGVLDTGTGMGLVQAKNVNIIDGQVVGSSLSVSATENYTQAGGTINAEKTSIEAGSAITLTSGSMVAKEAALTITGSGSITEAKTGYTLDADVLQVHALAGDIALDSQNNRLVNVAVYNNNGDIAIGSGNSKDAQALTVTTGSEIVNGALSITNYADGSDYLNEILVTDKLQATGAITIINKETDVNAEGSIITDNLTASAVGNLNLGSKDNQLHNVTLATENGSIMLGNGNSAGDALNISIQGGQPVQGNISITNYMNGLENSIRFQTALQATGDIELVNEEGNITVTTNTSISGKRVMLRAAESIYNHASVTAKEGINLHADKDLVNYAALKTRNGNIELIANEDVLNLGVVETLKGNIDIISHDGVIYNVFGADLLTGNGNVTLLAESSDGYYYYFKDNQLVQLDAEQVKTSAKGELYYEDANHEKYAVIKNGSVFNAGDLLALHGTITLEAVQGNLTNYDNFDSLLDAAGQEVFQYASDENANGVAIATGSIVFKAEKGTIYNDKDYLVALGDVSLMAQSGIGSYGDVILAGGNITMIDTDGDLVNEANLVSINGDISLEAPMGSVINSTKGELVALNGNVALNAAGQPDVDNTIYTLNTETGAMSTLDTGDLQLGTSIIITEHYYLDASVKKQYLSNTVLQAPNGEQIYTQFKYLDANNTKQELGAPVAGYFEAFRNGDVVNRGDIVAQNTGDKSAAAAGNVKLLSAHGNVTNYDDFKLVDGLTNTEGNGFYDFLGQDGYRTGAGMVVKFNADLGEEYNQNKRYILSDSGMELKAPEGSLYNDLDLYSKQDIVLESSQSLTIGGNFASVEAEGNITIISTDGSILNDSRVISRNGSIVLNAKDGVTSEVGAANLQALNGYISVVTTQGEIFIDELIAGQKAQAGAVAADSIKIGTVKGKDVVLYSESDATEIIVNKIEVEDHLVLQGNNFEHQDSDTGEIFAGLGKIERTNLDNTLVVDVNGAGCNGPVQSDFNMEIAGDVHFTTLNVTNAKVEIEGKLGVDNLHSYGTTHLTSLGYVTAVYGGGVAPYHDGSNALYYDLGDSWLNLYVDSSNYQRSNGLLLHIDTGYRSADQRWSAEDLGNKLVDFKSHTAFVTNYGDGTGYFHRYDLIEEPEKA